MNEKIEQKFNEYKDIIFNITSIIIVDIFGQNLALTTICNPVWCKVIALIAVRIILEIVTCWLLSKIANIDMDQQRKNLLMQKSEKMYEVMFLSKLIGKENNDVYSYAMMYKIAELINYIDVVKMDPHRFSKLSTNKIGLSDTDLYYFVTGIEIMINDCEERGNGEFNDDIRKLKEELNRIKKSYKKDEQTAF